MSRTKIVGGALAILGIGLEASAHTWSPQDAVWAGFACVVVGCFVLWFGDAK